MDADDYNKPKFEKFGAAVFGKETKDVDFSQIDKRKEVEEIYGTKIKKIVRYGFSKESMKSSQGGIPLPQC